MLHCQWLQRTFLLDLRWNRAGTALVIARCSVPPGRSDRPQQGDINQSLNDMVKSLSTDSARAAIMHDNASHVK